MCLGLGFIKLDTSTRVHRPRIYVYNIYTLFILYVSMLPRLDSLREVTVLTLHDMGHVSDLVYDLLDMVAAACLSLLFCLSCPSRVSTYPCDESDPVKESE